MPSRRKRLERPLVPLTESILSFPGSPWLTSLSYRQSCPSFAPLAFHSVTDALLENPNLNSSHLFRADILFDSRGVLKTNKEKEEICNIGLLNISRDPANEGLYPVVEDEVRPACSFARFELRRTVLRRLIPRKPQIDRPLLQTCHIYTEKIDASRKREENSPMPSFEEPTDRACSKEKRNDLLAYKHSIISSSQHLVTYQPHADPSVGCEVPWYHPPLKYLAFLYTSESKSISGKDIQPSSTCSVHFQFFQEHDIGATMLSDRLHRTVLSLLSTYARLTRNTPVYTDDLDGEQRAVPISNTQAIKDNIIPEHLLQNTYSRLKITYASNLIQGWVEKTNPSKHVFEDLSIAAFLIELWRKMYSDDPLGCPEFVDVACGNGVLVYCLIQEGYRGYGFDARARRTWSTFPENVRAHLQESVCIPRPFLDSLQSQQHPLTQDLLIHDGIFPANTFIISNHADELTAWTPLLAALSSPRSPLPWLAIPCCSHALSGAAHRYAQVKSETVDKTSKQGDETLRASHCESLEYGEQPRTGDLIALRSSREQHSTCLNQGQGGRPNSTYASLVQYVIALAKELHPWMDVQQTLMRIPSTRNVGIVGGERHRLYRHSTEEVNHSQVTPGIVQGGAKDTWKLDTYINNIIDRECAKSGGVSEAAGIWIKRLKQATGAAR